MTVTVTLMRVSKAYLPMKNTLMFLGLLHSDLGNISVTCPDRL